MDRVDLPRNAPDEKPVEDQSGAVARPSATEPDDFPFIGTEDGGSIPPEERPGGEAPPAGGAEQVDSSGADASSKPHPSPVSADRRKTYLAVGAGIVVLVLLLGLVSVWRAHSELGTLRREVEVLKAQTRRTQVQQERAAVLRVRAELQALRQTLPPDLALEIEKADGLVVGVDDRLKASQ